MRCVKCGYISFDNLSECKKCQTSMASVRDGLGFATARAPAPCLLGPLLGANQSTAQKKNHAAKTKAHVPFSLQQKRNGGLNEGFKTKTAEPAPPVADSGEAPEDFSLLDLSDEELVLLIEQDASEYGDGEEEQIEPSDLVDDEGDTYPHEMPSSLDAASASIEIEIPEETKASPAEELILSLEDIYETETPNLLIELGASEHREEEQIEPSDLVNGEGDTYPYGLPSSLDAVAASLEIDMPGEPEATKASPAEELILSLEHIYETDASNLLDLPADSNEAAPTIELEGAVDEPAVEERAVRPGEVGKDFVIDLSESELDALLKRLEGTMDE